MWKNWIKRQGVKDVAEKIGISIQAVHGWLRDEKRPSDIHKKRLIELAKGEFGYADFFADLPKAANE